MLLVTGTHRKVSQPVKNMKKEPKPTESLDFCSFSFNNLYILGALHL